MVCKTVNNIKSNAINMIQQYSYQYYESVKKIDKETVEKVEEMMGKVCYFLLLFKIVLILKKKFFFFFF
jgi:hypothetical protein